MKKMSILLIFLLSSNIFAMENPDPVESPSTWSKTKNFLGFSLSTDFTTPTHTTTKIAYSVASIGLGISELFLTDQIGDIDQASLSSQNILAYSLMSHGISNVFNGASTLASMVWNSAENYLRMPLQTSDIIKNAFNGKFQTGIQIIGGLKLIVDHKDPPCTLLNAIGFGCGLFMAYKGTYNILSIKTFQNQSTKPWHRMYNGFVNMAAGWTLNSLYLIMTPPTLNPLDETAIQHFGLEKDPNYIWGASRQEICKVYLDSGRRACTSSHDLFKRELAKGLAPEWIDTLPNNTGSAEIRYHYVAPGLLLISYGISELTGGIKDTFFLMGLILSSLKKEGNASKIKYPSTVNKMTDKSSSVRAKKIINPSFIVSQQQPQVSLPAYSNQFDSYQDDRSTQPEETLQKKQKNKTRPEKKEPVNLEVSQETTQVRSTQIDMPEPKLPKLKSMPWRQARTKLRQYGITLDDSAEGSRTTLSIGNTTRTIHVHGNGFELRGGRLQDVLYMLWVASQAELRNR